MLALERVTVDVQGSRILSEVTLEVGERELVLINPVEDAKLHGCRVRPRCGVLINHRFASIGPFLDGTGNLSCEATIVRFPRAVNCHTARQDSPATL